MLPGTTWAPALFSIEEFIGSLAGLREVDQVHCLVDLYRIHREMEGEKAQPFDEFLNWGPQLLSDFNEIDRYLVDPAALFTYLDEVRALTVWNPGNTPLTEFQKNYLKFYNSLLTYYERLSGMLLSRGEAYPGLIFRQAWQKLEKGEADVPWKKLVFAGFNALTTAEEKIIDHLVKRGDAELLWDADSYYLEDLKQEAGDYLRQWFRKWPEWSGRWKTDFFRPEPREIDVIGVPDLTGQVKLTGTLLEEIRQQQLLDERTAVVLPDEQLLLPLLNSLPEGMEEVNITMGLSLSQTSLAGLIVLVFDVHHHAVKLSSGKLVSGRFYFRDVLKVLQHPVVSRMVSSCMEGNEFVFRELLEKIRSGRQTFLCLQDLIPDRTGLFAAGLDFLDVLFTPWHSPADALTGLQNLVEKVVDSIRAEPDSFHDREETNNPPVEVEYAYAIARILRQLRLLLTGSADFLTWESLAKFLRQLLASTKLPFYGEPLKGLQIMGMLETRTLDFERVIILSCNEGILPSGKQVNSFIPYDIRRDFRLPLYRQQDAIYAYHFYRLIQRASHVWLLYNTEPGKLGGGDPSRFIRQIESELPGYCQALTLRKEVLVTPLVKGEGVPAIEIVKDETVMEKLLAKAVSGFSPTSLNAYRSCSLRFYFSEIAELKEPEEAEDEIDPRILGSAVHHALKSLFQPLLGKALSGSTLGSLEPLVEEAVMQGFREVFQGDGISAGKNLLLVEVAKIMIRNYIRREKALVEELAGKGETLTVTMLEKPLSGSLDLPVDGTKRKIRIKGFVDRVDRLGGITRVIDYKTGIVNSKEVAVKEWEALLTEPVLDKGFQLLTYAWLLAGQQAGDLLHAGILSLKKQGAGFITVSVPRENEEKPSRIIGSREIMKMGEILSVILEELYNPEESFRQTIDPERCTWCPYITLCGR